MRLLPTRKALRHSVPAGLLVVLLTAEAIVPAMARPVQPARANLAQVEAQVNALQEEAASAAEDWNQARDQLAQVNKRIAALQRTSKHQTATYKSVSKDLGGLIRTMYKTGSIDLDIQAMMASDPSAFLTHLDAISIVGTRQEASLRRILAAHQDLAQTAAELKTQRTQANIIAKRADAKRKLVAQKLAQAQKLLNSLQAADRKRRAARLAKLKREQAAKARKARKTVKVTGVSSGRVRRVLRYALAQVGDRYNMGSTGPSAYDCSGLTMMAYRQAGVNLSHYSRAQWGQTHRVSRSQLRPGDLIFFFRGIRHVAMYIGNGRMVHAASYGTGVIISNLDESYYRARVSGYGRVIS